MTAPCEKAKKPMKPMSSQTRRLLAAAGGKDDGHSGQTDGGAGGAGEQQLLAAEAIDDAHGDDGEEQVGGADGHRLKVAGDFVEAGALEDVVEVVENRVDAGHLVEEADSDGEHDGAAVLGLEERFDFGAVLGFDGADDIGDFAIGVGLTDAGEDLAGLLDEAAADQPARALRDAEEGDEEEQRGQGGDAQFPAPLFGAEAQGADHVVGEVRDQDSGHDIELEEADEASAFGGGRDLGDIHGADDGRSADGEAAEEAEPDEGVPVPGEGASEGGHDVEHGEGL